MKNLKNYLVSGLLVGSLISGCTDSNTLSKTHPTNIAVFEYCSNCETEEDFKIAKAIREAEMVYWKELQKQGLMKRLPSQKPVSYVPPSYFQKK